MIGTGQADGGESRVERVGARMNRGSMEALDAGLGDLRYIREQYRSRVAKICKNYGLFRVQKSAFLGDLNRNESGLWHWSARLLSIRLIQSTSSQCARTATIRSS